MRLWVRYGVEVFRGRFFKGRRSQTGRQIKTRRSAKNSPVSPDKRIPQSAFGTVKQKRNLCPVRPDNVTATARVAASTSVCRNINLLPFRRCLANYQTAQERLTHAQTMFAWNPSPLRPSRIAFEYLLLPPRSALAAVPRMLAHTLLYNRHALLLI